MEKQKLKKMVKILLENSLFLFEVFEKDNSLMFFLFLFVFVTKQREIEEMVWFSRKVALGMDFVMIFVFCFWKEKKVSE
jgi:hypothetical protein